MALINLYWWRQTKENKYLYFLTLIIILGVQVHFLVTIHFLTALIFWTSKNEKKNRLPIYLFMTVLCFMILPNSNLFSLTTSGYFIKDDLFSLFQDWFSLNGLENIRAYAQFFCLMFFISLSIFWQKLMGGGIKKPPMEFFIMVLIPLLTAFFVSTRRWYLNFVPILTLIFIVKYYNDLLVNKQRKMANLLLTFFGLSFIGFYFYGKVRTLHPNISHLYKMDSTQKELAPVAKRIYLQKRWEALKAMKKIYLIGFLPGRTSFFAHYSMAMEKVSKKLSQLQPIKREGHDGYMIIHNFKNHHFTDYSQKDWVEYFSQLSALPSHVQKEVRAGKIIIQRPEQYNKYWLIPYKTTHHSLFTEGFHNQAQDYFWEEPEWSKNCDKTKKFKKNNDFFYCMVLPGHLQRGGVRLRIAKEKNTPFIHLYVSFYGPLIGTANMSVNPEGFSLWKDGRIELLCNNRKSHYQLPDINQKKDSWTIFEESSYQVGNKLVSPLTLRFLTSCKKDIDKIQLSFKHFHLEKNREFQEKIKISWNND